MGEQGKRRQKSRHRYQSQPVEKEAPLAGIWLGQLFLTRMARLFVVLIASLSVISGCSTKPHVMSQTEVDAPSSENIYIARQGLHTGIVIPTRTIESVLPQLYDRFSGTPYIEFGWGDRAYYQSDEVTLGMTVKALVWPTSSVVRVVAIPERPDIHFADNDLETLCLDQKQFALLIAFISNSFLRDSDANIIKSKDDTINDSEFYQAEGRYHVFNTCNNWTAKGLKSAGLKISPTFKVTAGSVMGYLSKHEGGESQVLACLP